MSFELCILLTGAVRVVVAACADGGAPCVTGREVGESVGPAHRLHVVHVTLAPEVARSRQVDLERRPLIAHPVPTNRTGI